MLIVMILGGVSTCFGASPKREARDSAAISLSQSILKKRVIVKGDTVPIIIPQRNWGRYERGLYNFLFIPKGTWMAGMTASYGELNIDDMQLLSAISDFDFSGKRYSIRPWVGYFVRSNQAIGIKFNYVHGDATIGSLGVDIGDDLNFDLSNVGYRSNTYTAGFFYRNYVGLNEEKRFAVFNEVDLSFGGGTSRFRRYYDGELSDTHTRVFETSLNFSPGLCMFITDQVGFNVSFGVFGLHFRHEKQTTNGTIDGSRFSSGANFRFNIFNINFGIAIHI